MGLIFNYTHLNCNVVPLEEEGRKKKGGDWAQAPQGPTTKAVLRSSISVATHFKHDAIDLTGLNRIGS